MLRKLSALLAGLLLIGTASAAQVLYEDFNYAAGGLAGGVNGAATWAIHSGTTNPEQVTGTSLSYSGISGQIGGAATFPATSGDDENLTGAFSVTTATATTAYYAVIVNVATAQATGDYFFHFVNGVIGGNVFHGRLFAKSSGAGYVLGIQYASTAAQVAYDATVRTFSTPVYVVVKLNQITGTGNDTASLFINPTLDSSEPAANATSTQAVAAGDADWTNLDGIAIRQGTAGNAATGSVDTVRVGTTFADVTTSFVPVELSTFNAE